MQFTIFRKCTQIAHKLSPKIPCFSPYQEPYDRSRTRKIFFTLHLEIEVNFHLKFCQQYTRNLSNFTVNLHQVPYTLYTKNPRNIIYYRDLSEYVKDLYLLRAWATSTAQATVHPTIGLLPIPRNPIISTWAGTEDEPANCASLCIRPMVSVIP